MSEIHHIQWTLVVFISTSTHYLLLINWCLFLVDFSLILKENLGIGLGLEPKILLISPSAQLV